MRTFMANENNIERKWLLVDAEGKRLGRLASEVATILRGKHKPTYTPHVDTGDYVVVIDADKIEFSGKKLTDKLYYRHSNYPSGLKVRNAAEMMDKFPERVGDIAVEGTLPKNKLGSNTIKKIPVKTAKSIT